MSTTDISARCWYNISRDWGWDMGIDLCIWRKCQRCQGDLAPRCKSSKLPRQRFTKRAALLLMMIHASQSEALGSKMETVNWCNLWTIDNISTERLSYKSPEAFKVIKHLPLKLLLKCYSICKNVWLKKTCCVTEIIIELVWSVKPGQREQRQDRGFNHVTVRPTAPTTGAFSIMRVKYRKGKTKKT